MQSAPKVVLCIDDEDVILRLLQAVLESHGYVCLIASSAHEAREQVSAQPLDAVILDYLMPGTSGEELAAEIKGMAPGTSLIMFSGSVDVPPDMLRSIDAFVPKGEGFGVLLTVLRRLVQPDLPGARMARKFPRYVAELPFSVIVERAGGSAMVCGVTTSIGEGGVGGKVDADLLTGESVLLKISDFQLEMTLEKRAQVCYGSGGSYGFEFLDADQADVRRLCRRLAFG